MPFFTDPGVPSWDPDGYDGCAGCEVICDGNPQTAEFFTDGRAYCSAECMRSDVADRARIAAMRAAVGL